MNSKEIKEALEIIKKPIKVSCIEYKYFDEENYNKLLKVYENCLWFANNLEQINLTAENFEKENKQLKEQLQQKEDIINKARKYISKHTQHDENGYVVECLYVEEAKELLEILDNKGE